jgi:hypothetical protein
MQTTVDVVRCGSAPDAERSLGDPNEPKMSRIRKLNPGRPTYSFSSPSIPSPRSSDCEHQLEQLRTLHELHRLTKAAEEITPGSGQTLRLKSAIAAIKVRAQQEQKRLRKEERNRDFFNPSRYELCLAGIREQLTFGTMSPSNVEDLAARLKRISEEIEKTIQDMKP